MLRQSALETCWYTAGVIYMGELIPLDGSSGVASACGLRVASTGSQQ
jgi:hypothetical protein